MKTKMLIMFVLVSNLLFGQTNIEIQKLEDFTKIYGVVRYFHPSDESAKLNWDLFTVYAVEEIMKTNSQKEFESKVKELFLHIAPSITFENEKYNWNKINSKPVYWINFGLASGSKSNFYKRKRNIQDSIEIRLNNVPAPMDIYKLKLGNSFSVNIPLIVYEKDRKTLPTGNFEKYADLKPKIFDHYTAISNIIIMWSGLRHFYPYQDEMNIDWDKILKEGIANSYSNKTQEENFFTLRKFSHYFKDGHMAISFPKYYQTNSYSPLIKLKYLKTSQQLVISDLLLPIDHLKKGDIISLIDNKKPNTIIDSLNNYLSGSEQYTTHNAFREILKGKENSIISLTLENGKKVDLKRNSITYKNSDFFNKDNKDEIKELSDSILYINLQNLTQTVLTVNLEKIKNFKKIIIDLRGYPKKSEDSWKILGNTFFSDRNNVKFITTPKIQNPFYENMIYADYSGWDIKKNKELNSKVALLVYEGSASFQESIPQFLKGNNYVTIVGRMTAGANGGRNDISLLNGMGYSFTGQKVRNADGSIFHTIGVKPDIIVEDNMEDIKDGKDTFIEKAIEYLNKK